MNDTNLTRRALAAYFRDAGSSTDQPANTSGVRTANAKSYVVLENSRGVLAVFRVRNNGMLKRLRRWPAAVEVA